MKTRKKVEFIYDNSDDTVLNLCSELENKPIEEIAKKYSSNKLLSVCLSNLLSKCNLGDIQVTDCPIISQKSIYVVSRSDSTGSEVIGYATTEENAKFMIKLAAASGMSYEYRKVNLNNVNVNGITYNFT